MDRYEIRNTHTSKLVVLLVNRGAREAAWVESRQWGASPTQPYTDSDDYGFVSEIEDEIDRRVPRIR